MKTLLVLAVLGVILYHLGSGLYFMLADGDGSPRVVRALTRRIAWSVGLVALVLLGIATGVVQPHGVAG